MCVCVIISVMEKHVLCVKADLMRYLCVCVSMCMCVCYCQCHEEACPVCEG